MDLKEIDELKQSNIDLKAKIDKMDKEAREREEILFRQSRLASMGEMLGNISHQWRQPLMEIAALLMKVETRVVYENKIDIDFISEVMLEINTVLKYMSDTIDVFRNFYSDEKNKEKILASEIINSVEHMLGTSIKQSEIKYEVCLNRDIYFKIYKNEFLQVLINIINNAKEILLIRKIKEPKILLEVSENTEYTMISISDNGGGIKTNDISTIFKPFYTDKANGTGIGLFISKVIIEKKHNGRVAVDNYLQGARFIIKIKKD